MARERGRGGEPGKVTQTGAGAAGPVLIRDAWGRGGLVPRATAPDKARPGCQAFGARFV